MLLGLLRDRDEKIQRTLSPMITVFKGNEEIDEEGIREQVNFLIEGGAHGIIVCGSTGEFFNMSLEERKRVIKIVIDEVNGKVPVIAGTAECSTKLTIEMSKYAEDVGAEGLLIVPPYYYKPKEEEIYQHYQAVAENVDIPIMLYNNPWASGVHVSPKLLVKMAENGVIQYVKETHGDVAYVHEIIYLGGGEKPIVFFGRDENSFEAFVIGAIGWVSGAANVTVKLQRELFDLVVEKKDCVKGKELYYKLLPWFFLTERRGRWIAYVKAALELMGRKVGKPRRPIRPLNREEKEELRQVLMKLKLIDN